MQAKLLFPERTIEASEVLSLWNEVLISYFFNHQIIALFILLFRMIMTLESLKYSQLSPKKTMI